jgi:hypothetical protein
VTNGKVENIGPLTVVRNPNLPNVDSLTDQEMLDRFINPKLEGRKP